MLNKSYITWTIFLVSMLAVILKSEAKPIQMKDVIGMDGMRMLRKMVEYLEDDETEDDESVPLPVKRETSDSFYEPARGNKLQSSRGDGEMCKLPMKKGVCRALLPRWR